jgi:glycosyltransferase involved in cell wall biosynthesis
VLAHSGAPADLAQALQRLLDSPELRRRLGCAGQKRFNREFTDDAMRARFFAELEQVLPSGGGRRR